MAVIKTVSSKAGIRIYDDNEKTFDEKAKEFYIYRAGEYGCIIQKINN